jgi:hypothetical protein
MGTLIDRSNHFSVTVWISMFISSVAVTSTTSPFSYLWTNGIAPRDGLSKALLILRHIDFCSSCPMMWRMSLHLLLSPDSCARI